MLYNLEQLVGIVIKKTSAYIAFVFMIWKIRFQLISVSI